MEQTLTPACAQVAAARSELHRQSARDAWTVAALIAIGTGLLLASFRPASILIVAAVFYAARALRRLLRAAMIRWATRSATWRSVQLRALDQDHPYVVRETGGTEWLRFRVSVPRRFSAFVSSDSVGWWRVRWRVACPTESHRADLARVSTRAPSVCSRPPVEPRRSIDVEVGDTAPACVLTNDGLVLNGRDTGTGESSASVEIRRGSVAGRVHLHGRAGDCFGYIERTPWAYELRDAEGVFVMELESRFGAHFFWHEGRRIASSDACGLSVRDRLVSPVGWRAKWHCLWPMHRLESDDRSLIASARMWRYSPAALVRLDPTLEPVPAAVVLLGLAPYVPPTVWQDW